MLRGATIAVVVPAYNEALLIARTLTSVPAFVDHIVVVDDGSSDGTCERARGSGDPRVVVEVHGHNRGVGAAIATGYQRAFASGADVVAVMAGDAQMDPTDLQALLWPVIEGEADYTKGDRLSHPQAMRLMPLTRWLGNHLLSLFTRWVTRLPVQDSQCGYTALSRRAAELVPLSELWPRYGYPNDLLAHLAEHGGRVRDVVVRPVYADERSGIGLRHALFVVPFVLVRALSRRVLAPRALPWAAVRR